MTCFNNLNATCVSIFKEVDDEYRMTSASLKFIVKTTIGTMVIDSSFRIVAAHSGYWTDEDFETLFRAVAVAKGAVLANVNGTIIIRTAKDRTITLLLGATGKPAGSVAHLVAFDATAAIYLAGGNPSVNAMLTKADAIEDELGAMNFSHPFDNASTFAKLKEACRAGTLANMLGSKPAAIEDASGASKGKVSSKSAGKTDTNTSTTNEEIKSKLTEAMPEKTKVAPKSRIGPQSAKVASSKPIANLGTRSSNRVSAMIANAKMAADKDESPDNWSDGRQVADLQIQAKKKTSNDSGSGD